MVEKIIARYLDHPKEFFVFPSEVTGGYILRRAALQSEGRVVRSDRFLSWDRLKEREFSPSRERLPANTLYRTLFSISLLEEHARKGPLLKVFPGPGTDPSVFQNQIASMLAQLQRLVKLLDEGPSAFPQELREDLLLLYNRYLDFLDKNGLFEPAYIVPHAGTFQYHYHIFYPELIEDFKEYRHLIEGTDSFSVYSLEEIRSDGAYETTTGKAGGPVDRSGIGGEEKAILRFENARQELQHLVTRIHQLLDSGVHPADIAITLPDYDTWRPFLEEEARVRDIPLDFRAGRTLTEYPAGLLFKRIGDLFRNGMALDQFKQLVLEQGYPWRDRAALEKLIRFGVEHFFIRNQKSGGTGSDTLSSKLKVAGGGLLQLYMTLKKHLHRLMTCRSATALQKEVHIFLRTYFDPAGWDPEAEKVLQYCLLVLREMREAEERLESLEIPSPYALWTSLMGRRIYVSGSRGRALPVYRYRVSAGITPRYHFIPGAGQTETRVNREDFAFLREDYRALLSGEAAPDFSGSFLAVYAGSGEEVQMSCSDRGFGGPQLPPEECMEAGLVESAGPLFDSSGGGPGASAAVGPGPGAFDPFLQEELFWALEGDFPSRIFPLQKTGFEAMIRTGFAPKKIDHTRTEVEDAFLKTRMEKVIRGEKGAEDGRVWISPTSFDRYIACPYHFLLESGLKLGREEYSAPFVEHRLMGTMLHRILAELYKRVQEEDGRWKREHTDRYLEIGIEECRRDFAETEARGLAFLKPSWEWFRAAAEEQIAAFIHKEGDLFDGYELIETESEVEALSENGQAGMAGRIDRLSMKEGKAALVDYKKGKMPTRAEVYQEEGLPAVSQLPFYAHVAEKNNYKVASASYYSVQDRRFSHIYVHPEAPVAAKLGRAKAVLFPEDFAAQAQRIAGSIELVAEEMKRGNYRTNENCKSCELRSICRTKYNLRLPEEKSGNQSRP